ncbi:MAG TPA: hypothetical protein PKE00_13175 [Planctomycetota bacterium]|nr:hypothetical protein [Planctomycetota bacterium]
MRNPLDDFEDQFTSYELVQQNLEALAEEARDWNARCPGIEAVGLILDAKVAEAEPFIAALEQACGQKLPVSGFLGVVPRSFAVDILRKHCTAALDNLPNGRAGELLPVLVSMGSGYRFAEVAYTL